MEMQPGQLAAITEQLKDIKERSPFYNMMFEGIDLGDGRRLGREFILTAQKLPIYETAAKYKGGACVITGGSDVIVPVKYGRRFHGVLVGSSFHLLPEEDHNFSRSYKSSIAIGADYLVRVLSPRGGASAK